MKRAWAVAAVMLLPAVPAVSQQKVFVGAGPNIGLWDVADGHHIIGLYTVAMWHPGSERRTSFRFDASYSRFWAEGNVGNEDYSVLTFLADVVVTFSQGANERPYWTLGAGYDTSSDNTEDGSGIVLGTGIGLRTGWGVIEARFDLASTQGGLAAYVPVFVAAGF